MIALTSLSQGEPRAFPLTRDQEISMTQASGFRGRIYDDITQTIGHTPLVRLRRVVGDTKAIVVAKLLFIDFAHLAGLERIASFIGVGLLMLAIGYLAPVPPKGDRPL